MDFPGIAKASLEIAYGNGGINRYRTEEKMLGELDKFLSTQPSETLPAIDKWLLSLSGEDIELICAGDQDEAAKVLAGAPPFTDQLLNDYFEKVC